MTPNPQNLVASLRACFRAVFAVRLVANGVENLFAYGATPNADTLDTFYRGQEIIAVGIERFHPNEAIGIDEKPRRESRALFKGKAFTFVASYNQEAAPYIFSQGYQPLAG